MARGVIEIFASIGVSIRNPSGIIAAGFLDYDEPGMLPGHSDFKSLTLRYRWALCRGRAFVTPHERSVSETGEVCRDGPVRARDDARTAAGGRRQAKVQGKYKGREPTARAKAQDVIRLFKEGNAAASSRLRHGSSLPGE